MLSGIGHAEHLTDNGITTIADLPVGDNLHDHMFHALTFHVTSSKMKGNALVLRQGRAPGAAPPGQDVHGQLGLRVGGLRAYVAGDRRTRPPAAPAAVVLRLAQPGRADPSRRRPAHVADGAGDADLPEEPGHPAAGLGRPDGRAADRLRSTSPTRPTSRCSPRARRWCARSWAARRSAARSRRRSTPVRTSRARTCASAILNRATSVYHGVGTCRMGVDELCRRRTRPQGPRHRRSARGRRLDHAVDHRWQHQRARDHDRREGRRPASEQLSLAPLTALNRETDAAP